MSRSAAWRRSRSGSGAPISARISRSIPAASISRRAGCWGRGGRRPTTRRRCGGTACRRRRATSAAARNSSRLGCPHHTLMPPARAAGQRRQTHAVHAEQRRRTMAGERERRELAPAGRDRTSCRSDRAWRPPARDARRAWPRWWPRRRAARRRTCWSATCRHRARAGSDDRRCRTTLAAATANTPGSRFQTLATSVPSPIVVVVVASAPRHGEALEHRRCRFIDTPAR